DSGVPARGKSRRAKKSRADGLRDWVRRNRWAVAGGAGALALLVAVWALSGSSKKKTTDTVKSEPVPPVAPSIVPAPQITPATAAVQPGGKGFQVAIGSTKAAPGKFVSVARVELVAAGAPAAAAPPSAAPLFALDLSRLTPFTTTFQDGQHGNFEWQSRVPAG